MFHIYHLNKCIQIDKVWYMSSQVTEETGIRHWKKYSRKWSFNLDYPLMYSEEEE